MDETILKQLLELTAAFGKIGIKPVVCGDLGIYLLLKDSPKELPLRITNDIDLMLTNQQITDINSRRAIYQTITDTLEYTVCEDGKYFMFEKDNHQYLDILTPPVNCVEIEGFRAKILETCLHGHITPEAQFIEEDIKTISLTKFLPNNNGAADFEVHVPSPTNLLILKLFAFNDRDSGSRQDDNKARSHAYDIFMIVTKTNIYDYREGFKFLYRHSDSQIVQKAQNIVDIKFQSENMRGWKRVMENSAFYPNLKIKQKQEKIHAAMNRLTRWFSKIDIKQH